MRFASKLQLYGCMHKSRFMGSGGRTRINTLGECLPWTLALGPLSAFLEKQMTGARQGAPGGGTDAAAAFRSLLLLLGGRGRWRTLALDGLGMGVVSGCTPCRIKCRRSAVLRSFHLFLIGEYHQPSCASSVGVRRSHWLQQLSSPGMHVVAGVCAQGCSLDAKGCRPR